MSIIKTTLSFMQYVYNKLYNDDIVAIDVLNDLYKSSNRIYILYKDTDSPNNHIRLRIHGVMVSRFHEFKKTLDAIVCKVLFNSHIFSTVWESFITQDIIDRMNEFINITKDMTDEEITLYFKIKGIII